MVAFAQGDTFSLLLKGTFDSVTSGFANLDGKPASVTIDGTANYLTVSPGLDAEIINSFAIVDTVINGQPTNNIDSNIILGTFNNTGSNDIMQGGNLFPGANDLVIEGLDIDTLGIQIHFLPGALSSGDFSAAATLANAGDYIFGTANFGGTDTGDSAQFTIQEIHFENTTPPPTSIEDGGELAVVLAGFAVYSALKGKLPFQKAPAVQQKPEGPAPSL